MPKAAARIWLEVLGTRVERLQEITEEDAGKEGVNFCCPSYRHAGWNDRWISGYCHDCKHHDPMTGKRPTCYFRHGYEEESRFQWWCGCSSGSFTLRDDNISEPSRFKYAFVWDELRRKVKAIGPAYWQSNPYVEVLEFRRVER